MLYVSLTFWLLVIVLTAWGVHRLWSGMVQAKVLNTLLLPGTLVAQVGHVLGLLVTGATISNTTLYQDSSGEPQITKNPEPKIPVLGPVIIGLLPIVACAAGICAIAGLWGDWLVSSLKTGVVGPTLPASLGGVWDLLRGLISLVESLVGAVRSADYGHWHTWAFLYLLACLAVRSAPFPGTMRGALGAIVLLGVGGALASTLFDVADPRIQNGWAVLNLAVASLLLLLMVSLLARGVVGLFRTLAQNA